MSRIHLSLHEARVIGCLMEKAVLTPDQCPLTLNALMAACNQKSSREPVLALDRATVERVGRDLQEKSLVTRDENSRTGVVKYRQRLCNTMFSDLSLAEDEYAVLCLLLLRGPQTPGELRARSARLHGFADNGAVADTLLRLMDTAREGGPLVANSRGYPDAATTSTRTCCLAPSSACHRTRRRRGPSPGSEGAPIWNSGSPRWNWRWRRSSKHCRRRASVVSREL